MPLPSGTGHLDFFPFHISVVFSFRISTYFIIKTKMTHEIPKDLIKLKYSKKDALLKSIKA